MSLAASTSMPAITMRRTDRASSLRRWLDGTYRAAGAVGAACIALICVLMVAQTLGRRFGYPTGAITDVVSCANQLS